MPPTRSAAAWRRTPALTPSPGKMTMRYGLPPALLRLSIPLCAMLLCAACVGAPPIVTTPNACSTLIPDSWRAPVAGADLPEGNTVADWVAFGDAQTGQLDKAN